MNRRDFLIGSAAAATAKVAIPAATSDFTFVHLTDTHIQPELRAAEGCRQCFTRVNSLKPDFVLAGGDLVFDAAAVSTQRAKSVYTLYRETVKTIEAPVHAVVGNHDVFGVFTESGATPDHPSYGKRIYEDQIGKRHYSFDHKGWRFIGLDSIYLTAERGFVGRIDDDQLSWLSSTLSSTPKTMPLVVLTHIPLVTAFPLFSESKGALATLTVANAREVLDLLWPFNLRAVLQGHTHVRETVHYNNCQFITSGAVCGNWWKGLRLGHPEGFGVLSVSGGHIAWRYETYGFRADL